MEKIKDVRKRLLSNPPDMPSWIYVDPGSVSPAVAALDYWLRAVHEKTVVGILQYHKYVSPGELHDTAMGFAGANPVYKERAQAIRSKVEQEVSAIIDGMSEVDIQAKAKSVHRPGFPMSEARRIVTEDMVEDLLDRRGACGRRGTNVLGRELAWYKAMGCFYPPKELEKRHLWFVELMRQVMEQEARGERSHPDERVIYAVRILLPFAPFHEPGSRQTCLIIFSHYIRPVRNVTRFGRPTSRSL